MGGELLGDKPVPLPLSAPQIPGLHDERLVTIGLSCGVTTCCLFVG